MAIWVSIVASEVCWWILLSSLAMRVDNPLYVSSALGHHKAVGCRMAHRTALLPRFRIFGDQTLRYDNAWTMFKGQHSTRDLSKVTTITQRLCKRNAAITCWLLRAYGTSCGTWYVLLSPSVQPMIDHSGELRNHICMTTKDRSKMAVIR
ncbi:hypothetical protein BD410DRAFT_791041 [Rickenella mellea]|uniref:Secreted protein n=1 Tax=Rickenella mellea TaxID=50990 RepID=A0A4Y7PXY1_9AGAM|nr:hypothetical protein BD410DRAFT_791041 [Rickenella mellea]